MNDAFMISGTAGHVGAWRRRAVRVCCQSLSLRATSDIILLSHMIDTKVFQLEVGMMHSSSNSRNVDGETIVNSYSHISEILHNCQRIYFKLLR